MSAAFQGHANVVTWLVDNGNASVNALDPVGCILDLLCFVVVVDFVAVLVSSVSSASLFLPYCL